MLSSITPLGERGRGMRWVHTATAYVVGAVLGGLAVGAVLGGAGAAVAGIARRSSAAPSVTAVLLTAALLLAAAAAADAARVALPPTRRQVNEDWLPRYRGWVYGAGFGLQLGMGVTTIVTSASTYAALGLAGLTLRPDAGALVGATYGLARALPVLVVRRAGDPVRLQAVFRRVAAAAVPARRVTVSAQAGLAGVALLAAAVLA